MKQLFWVAYNEILIQSSIDGSQQITHQLDQQTCLGKINIEYQRLHKMYDVVHAPFT